MLTLRLLGLEFEIFELSIPEFVLLQSVVQKQKSLNVGPKISDLGIFGLEFENIVIIFEISTLDFV